jgi:hypothetical protein
LPPPKPNISLPLFAVFGCIIYVVLYIIAASLYPGGSNFGKHTTGYQWNLNYWCELLAATAKNGEPNTARPVAFAAMAVMAVSIGICWYYLPVIFQHKYKTVTIRYCGIIAILISVFLPFAHHDAVINISAFFMVVAILSVFIGFYQNRYYGLLALGIVCFAFATTNKLVYEFASQKYLPVIQEVAFFCFLLWFALTGWKIHTYFKKNCTE